MSARIRFEITENTILLCLKWRAAHWLRYLPPPQPGHTLLLCQSERTSATAALPAPYSGSLSEPRPVYTHSTLSMVQGCIITTPGASPLSLIA